MQTNQLKILHLEDSPNDAFLIASLIENDFRNVAVVQVDNREDFLQAIEDPAIRIVLSDYSLPSYDGIRALSDARNVRAELPFIFVSGAMGEDMAVECMKIGATDYVLKSNLKRLSSAIRRALSEMDIRSALTQAAQIGKVVPWHWNDTEDTWLFGNLVNDILGYHPNLLSTTPGFLKSKVHVEDLPRFVSSFALAKARERMDFDCRLLHGGGNWLWTRWTLAWSDGRCRGILQDITELRLAQDALIQSQRLETLGMMIVGITHDFGNLIHAMNGAVELLSMTPLSEAQRRYLDALGKSCVRASDFKAELLRLARKEDAPVRVPTDLNAILQEAAVLLGHALPKSMPVVMEPCADLPPVPAVPSQLLQVLMNLGLNARDAMVSDGTIRLRTGFQTLSEAEALEHHRPAGNYVFLEVSDTGPGIPPELLEQIFDPFFTTKELDKGTGLGLSMVRAIIQQHDGVIRVRSKPGEGASFHCLLPLA